MATVLDFKSTSVTTPEYQEFLNNAKLTNLLDKIAWQIRAIGIEQDMPKNTQFIGVKTVSQTPNQDFEF